MTETLTHGAPGVDDLDALYPAGELLPESLPHERVRGDTRPVLEHHFDSRGDVLVGSNLRLYYREGPPGESVEPDVLVVAGVNRAQLADIKSYRTFQHGGELLFVLEIASESTADARLRPQTRHLRRHRRRRILARRPHRRRNPLRDPARRTPTRRPLDAHRHQRR